MRVHPSVPPTTIAAGAPLHGALLAGVLLIGALLIGGTPAAAASAPEAAQGPHEPLVRIRVQDTPTASGRPVTYVLEARNPGSRDLPRAVVNQLLPPVLHYRDATPKPATASAGQLRWTVAIPAGETVRIRVRGTVAADRSDWNRLGVGQRPRVDTTACVSVDARSAVSSCHTASHRAALVVPWWRSLYALVGYALILGLGVPAGIVLLRRQRAPDRLEVSRAVGG